jgi:hypothetical protein
MALSGVSLASLAGFHLFLIACFALQLRGFFGWLGGAFIASFNPDIAVPYATFMASLKDMVCRKAEKLNAL